MDNSSQTLGSPEVVIYDPSVPVPDDFPRPGMISALTGFGAKVALVEFEGKYYVDGASPRQVWGRWSICDDLVRQLAAQVIKSKAGKRSHMSLEEILDQYLVRALNMHWMSVPEKDWMRQKCMQILSSNE